MKRMARRLHADERGQVLVSVALLMLGLVAIAGLVADGGMLFAQRRDLQNVADAAALAGAMQLDVDGYRASGGTVVELDEGAAYSVAVAYLAGEGDLAYAVDVSPVQVEVSASREARTTFLRLLGIGEIEIGATASSQPRYGVFGAGP